MLGDAHVVNVRSDRLDVHAKRLVEADATQRESARVGHVEVQQADLRDVACPAGRTQSGAWRGHS